jgi:DNA-binding cell septation regulator SpoVG
VHNLNCATSWLFLQDYKGLHGQQNLNFAMPNKQNEFINIRISKQNCTRLMRQSGKVINCAPNCLYLQDYTEIYGQQNLNFAMPNCTRLMRQSGKVIN